MEPKKTHLYNRPSIMLTKSKKMVDKNQSLAEKEHAMAQEALKAK